MSDWKQRAAAAAAQFNREHRAELRPEPPIPTPKHRAPEDNPERLTVADVARLRKVDRTTANRWLRRNAKQYLVKKGKTWFILAADYARLTEPPAQTQFDRRLAELESLCSELERRLDAHVRRHDPFAM